MLRPSELTFTSPRLSQCLMHETLGESRTHSHCCPTVIAFPEYVVVSLKIGKKHYFLKGNFSLSLSLSLSNSLSLSFALFLSLSFTFHSLFLAPTHSLCSYPTPPSRTGCDTWSVLSEVQLVWIRGFSSRPTA